MALLDRTDAASRPVRLLGVSVHNFIAVAQLNELPEGWLPFDDADEDFEGAPGQCPDEP